MGRDRQQSNHSSSHKHRRESEREKLKRKMEETPEERKRRRLDKKKRKDKARKTKEEEEKAFYGGYTNAANPFGDNNLTGKFVWKLKDDRDKRAGREKSRDDRERKLDIRRELEKVKKRREDRAVEQELWEEERQRQEREASNLQYADWEKNEDEFHKKQAYLRAEIRIREGRPKPIDALYKNLHLHQDFDVNLAEPYSIFRGLSLSELEDFQKDILVFQELDPQEFWKCMLIVCEDELLASSLAYETQAVGKSGARTGMHNAITSDVQDMLEGKTSDELSQLKVNVESKLDDGKAVVDSEYWEALLKRIGVYHAKARLREIHQDLLKRYLEMLEEQEQEQEQEQKQKQKEKNIAGDDGEGWEADEPPVVHDVDQGNLSPELVPLGDQLDSDEEVVDAEEDMQELKAQKEAILEANSMREHNISAEFGLSVNAPTEEELFALEEERYMEEGEEPFNGAEVSLNQTYSFSDKYRPRKPRYFNRVHTGYEWNKYNQSHYDHDNPPPKVVQGYKFNIFYPDLLDRSKAPTFFIEPDPENDLDFCILRIHAGPPYEDVAFRIVNRKWEFSRRRGFRCVFDHGILHLWFQFRRFRYRR